MPATLNEVMPLPPAFLYARMLCENQSLIASGKGDTPEAEALADRMDGPWYQMTLQERARMEGLSEDLYALAEGGPKRVEMLPDQLSAWQRTAKDVYTQSEPGQVDAALTFLRQPIPSTLPRYIIPFLQARCWEKLGDLETAFVFRKEAERLILANIDEPVLSHLTQQTSAYPLPNH